MGDPANKLQPNRLKLLYSEKKTSEWLVQYLQN